MKLVVGLGNPGSKYETTRHNAGFLAIDRMVDRWQAKGPKIESLGEVWTASVGGEKVLLVKPQTFMNSSGKTVGPLAKFYKCEPTDIIVLHDDLDLKSMALRIKTGGGTGGHNGLKSIDQHLGAANTGYHRVRIGIGRPMPNEEGKGIATVDFVLQPYSDNELRQLDPILDDIAKATEMLIAGDARRAMNEFNVQKGPENG